MKINTLQFGPDKEFLLNSPIKIIYKFANDYKKEFDSIIEESTMQEIDFKNLLIEGIKKEIQETQRQDIIGEFNINIEELADALYYIMSKPHGEDYTEKWNLVLEAKNIIYYMSDKIKNNAPISILNRISEEIARIFK